MSWYAKTVEEVSQELAVDHSRGLTADDAQKRQEQYGPNALPEPPKDSLLKKFLGQFTNVLVLVLIGATIISFLLGEHVDAAVIFVIVIMNGVLGFVQEYKAEKSLEALKSLSAQFALVYRDGEKHKIPIAELVPGDVIELTAGDKAPADARVIEGFNLTTSEAILTGESLPVDKNADVLEDGHLALGDQHNMVFKDTIIASGRGKAIVVATGALTEIGKISTLLSEQEEGETPLQKELDGVGKRLSVAAGVVIVVVFVVGVLVHTTTVIEMFLTSVALAVAAIPEGLPAVVTIVLSLGVTRMAKQKAIVKKLPAVETLGATSIICSDKTGTLTQNRIRVASVALRDWTGETKQVADHLAGSDTLQALLTNGVVNSDASVGFGNENPEEVGDQTEVALLFAAHEAGMDITNMRDTQPVLFEIPFDSDTKYMVTVTQQEGSDEVMVWLKGAPEVVLGLSNISQEDDAYWADQMKQLAQKGLRTLGFAHKSMPADEWAQVDTKQRDFVAGFTFSGMVGQQDPLRPEVADALKLAQQAGVRTVMITGDHKLTALAIAEQLGLASQESEVMTGTELADISDDELEKQLDTLHVFARVNPEQKLRLVKLFQKKYHAKVAVTGDGVNDAPAIKAADIGIAMGIEGTDVSREVADLVLQDDNYATIVSAVREGRVVFANLVKFIRYLISCNISEIFVVFFAILLGYPTPLLPIQLLWINLVTDGLPALALGMDSPELDVMQVAPRDTKEGILNKRRWLHMTLEGLVIGVGTLVAFVYTYHLYGEEIARTVAFSTLAVAQLIHSLNNRSEKFSIFRLGFTTNKLLLATIVASLSLQALVLYTPIGNTLFKAVPLGWGVVDIVLVCAIMPLLYVEMRKFVTHRLHRV